MDEFEIARLAAQGGVAPWWPAVEPSPRWIRVRLGETVIADTRRGLLYLQYGRPPMLPTYFIPIEDVADGVLTEPQLQPDGSTRYTVVADDRRIEGGAWSYHSPTGEFAGLADTVTFTWQDPSLTWWEEEEALFAHARDPHKRVDVAPSSRHVQVTLGGEVMAESRRPLLLFETLLPARFYLPAEDVRTDLLTPSDTVTMCPYKGTARYWSATIGGTNFPDVVWSYPDPVPENPRIRGLMAFFNERADLVVDGEPLGRPASPWS